MQFYYRGDDLAPFWHFLGLELLYNGIFIISLQDGLTRGAGGLARHSECLGQAQCVCYQYDYQYPSAYHR